MSHESSTLVSAPQKSPTRVSYKNLLQKCPMTDTMPRSSPTSPEESAQNSFPQGCPTRLSHKSFQQECPKRVSRKSAPQECPSRAPRTKVSYKSVPQECQTKFGFVFERVFAFGFVGSILFFRTSPPCRKQTCPLCTLCTSGPRWASAWELPQLGLDA